jgi:hypothetical protein
LGPSFRYAKEKRHSAGRAAFCAIGAGGEIHATKAEALAAAWLSE